MKKINIVSVENKGIKVEVYNEPLWGYTVEVTRLMNGDSSQVVYDDLNAALSSFNQLLEYGVK